MKYISKFTGAVCFLSVIALVGCSGGGGSKGPEDPPPVARAVNVDIELPNTHESELEIGESFSLDQLITLEGDLSEEDLSVAWVISDESVLQHNNDGQFEAVGAGSALVSVNVTYIDTIDGEETEVSAFSDPVTIDVLCDIDSLVIEPSDTEIALGQPYSVDVSGECADGSARDIPSDRLTVTALTPSVAILTNDNQVNFLNYGEATFSVFYNDVNGVPTIPTQFKLSAIDPVMISGLAISPDSLDLCVSQGINLAAQQLWSDGSAIPVSQGIEYTVAGQTIDPSAYDTSVENSFNIEGCLDGFCDTVSVEVSACPYSVFVKTSEWESPYIYAWNDSSKPAGDWPGTALTSVGDDWYRFDLPSADPINIVFANYDENINSSAPTQSQNYTRSQLGFCELNAATNGKASCNWTDEDPRTPEPAELVVHPRGSDFNESVEVTLDWKSGAKGQCYYTLDGSSPLDSGTPCSAGDTINLGEALGLMESVTLRYCVINAAGEVCDSHTYKKTAEPAFSWDNATVYFVLTDRFENGDNSNDVGYPARQAEFWDKLGTFHGGDLKGLTNKITDGYFADLGVNVLWISSPLEQVHGWARGGVGDDPNGWFKHYAYHGYWPKDFTQIDANMGTANDFQTLIDTAHENGIRIVMDVVMNHVGYYTLHDLDEDNIDVLVDNWQDENIFLDYFDLIDFESTNFVDGWGPDWIRAGLGGHVSLGPNTESCPTIDDCPETGNIAYLPDLKTESTNYVDLPPFLAARAAMGATNAQSLANTTVREYLIKWLTDWVRDYGIDGFRVDTVRHVEKEAWQELKVAAVDALRDWKAANPEKKLDDLDFWMTGEYWLHQPQQAAPDGTIYYNSGFDSMINFDFQNVAKDALSSYANLESAYSDLAARINSNPNFNLLHYISSHDRGLFLGVQSNEGNPNATAPFVRPVETDNPVWAQQVAGTALLLSPGAVQIYYGDETMRQDGVFLSDPGQASRSAMNFGENAAVLSHWQKLGQFRHAHKAIGAGEHEQLAASPYTFSRVSGADKVVVALGATGQTTITVGGVFDDGVQLTDAYSGETAVVTNGKVTIDADVNGVVLLTD